MSNWIVIGSRAPIACQLSIYARNSNKMESILTPIQSPTKTIIYNSTVFILLFFFDWVWIYLLIWFIFYFLIFFLNWLAHFSFSVWTLPTAYCKTKQNKTKKEYWCFLYWLFFFPSHLVYFIRPTEIEPQGNDLSIAKQKN